MATALSPHLVYRGIPASDTHTPDPVEVVALWNTVLSGINGVQGGLIGFEDKATMDADLAHDAGTFALVYNDATVANNTTYVKSGASGAGSWAAIPQIAEKYIVLANAGAGTGDAIQLTSQLALPSNAYGGKFLTSATDANTGAVTIAVNGGTAKDLVTNTGAALAAGYLAAGMVIEFVDDGTNYRLTSDVASAAIQAAAETARTGAETAETGAETAQGLAEAAAALAAQRFVRVDVVDTAGGDPATDYEAGDTVDGVTLATNDLVLRATDGGNASDGVYVVPASGAASRASQFDAYDDHPGSYFAVMEGSTYADTLWRCTSDKGGTLDSTAIVIAQASFGATGVAAKNYAINPHFDVWQAGTSFTYTAGGTVSGWTADGWIADADNDSGSTGECTVTRETFTVGQTDVPGGPQYYLQFDQTTGAENQANIEHRIGEVRELSDTTICISIWMRCTSGTVNITPRAQQVFGSGGSTRVSVSANESDWTVTTTYQRFFATFDMPSVSGKTFGSPVTGSGPSLDISLLQPTGSTYTLQIAQFKIEEGTEPTDLIREDASAIRNRCLELFERITNNGALGLTFLSGHMQTATVFRGTLSYYPKNPGYTPDVSFSALSTFDINSAAATDAPSQLTAETPQSNVARIGAVVSGYTAGQAAALRSNVANDPVTATIDISARY
jgi:hypothetical protein